MIPNAPPENSFLAAKRLELGQAVRQLRVSRKLTQRQLAVALGWSRPKLVAIEAGMQATTVDQLHQVAQVLGVAVTVFFPAELHCFDPWNPATEKKGRLTDADRRRRRRV